MNFSKRSFHFSVFSIILLVAFLILSTTNRNGSTAFDSVVGYLITLFFVTVIIGFVLALLSIKEKASLKKHIALVVNIGLALLLTYHTLQNLSTISQAFS